MNKVILSIYYWNINLPISINRVQVWTTCYKNLLKEIKNITSSHGNKAKQLLKVKVLKSGTYATYCRSRYNFTWAVTRKCCYVVKFIQSNISSPHTPYLLLGHPHLSQINVFISSCLFPLSTRLPSVNDWAVTEHFILLQQWMKPQSQWWNRVVMTAM